MKKPTVPENIPTSSADGIEQSTAMGSYRAALVEELVGSPAELQLQPATTAIRIDTLSVRSLYLKLQFGKTLLSTATGFVVAHYGRHFLVSNWHVFSGRHPETNTVLSKSCGLPNEVRIAHHQANKLGAWRFFGEPLLTEDGSPRWVTHPAGSQIDVAALELRLPKWADIYPLDLRLADVDVEPYPGLPISIIGFPLGLRENVFFPIWKTGHIAADHDIPHKGLPAFLIDATTREGMSGSPVVVRTTGSYMRRDGHQILGGSQTRFLGVYSGRVHEHAEIGRVWRPSAVQELLDYAVAR